MIRGTLDARGIDRAEARRARGEALETLAFAALESIETVGRVRVRLKRHLWNGAATPLLSARSAGAPGAAGAWNSTGAIFEQARTLLGLMFGAPLASLAEGRPEAATDSAEARAFRAALARLADAGRIEVRRGSPYTWRTSKARERKRDAEARDAIASAGGSPAALAAKLRAAAAKLEALANAAASQAAEGAPGAILAADRTLYEIEESIGALEKRAATLAEGC